MIQQAVKMPFRARLSDFDDLFTIEVLIISVQWGMFLLALALALMSRKTSRAHLVRHEGFQALA